MISFDRDCNYGIYSVYERRLHCCRKRVSSIRTLAASTSSLSNGASVRWKLPLPAKRRIATAMRFVWLQSPHCSAITQARTRLKSCPHSRNTFPAVVQSSGEHRRINDTVNNPIKSSILVREPQERVVGGRPPGGREAGAGSKERGGAPGKHTKKGQV